MKDEEKKIVEEPSVVYGYKDIQTFGSFEEMNVADAKAWLEFRDCNIWQMLLC